IRGPSGVADQLKDGSARRDGAKRGGGRAGGHVEETLNLGGEAIEERFDNLGLVGFGRLANRQRRGTGAASQHDATGRARIAGPCSLAASSNQPSPTLEFEQVDGGGEGHPRFSAADLEQAHV